VLDLEKIGRVCDGILFGGEEWRGVGAADEETIQTGLGPEQN
jgi:hypothetical protein